MIQNPSVAGERGNAENVPVVFDTPFYPSFEKITCTYTTVENGDIVFNEETKISVGGTIYALKGSILYCTTRSSNNSHLNISSGGTLIVSSTYKDSTEKNHYFRVYQVTG